LSQAKAAKGCLPERQPSAGKANDPQHGHLPTMPSVNLPTRTDQPQLWHFAEPATIEPRTSLTLTDFSRQSGHLRPETTFVCTWLCCVAVLICLWVNILTTSLLEFVSAPRECPQRSRAATENYTMIEQRCKDLEPHQFNTFLTPKFTILKIRALSSLAFCIQPRYTH